MKSKLNSFLKFIVGLALFCAIIYGGNRLYYKVTGGFTINNITSDLAYDPRWDVPTSDPTEKIKSILSQEFIYLGKGCQAYVFESHDGNFVIKFFKYQRFRPHYWLNWVSFLPGIECYKTNKLAEKKKKLENVFTSWKIAYENLPNETGVIFLHLNKTDNLNQTLAIRDKMGILHHLDADKYEFMIQYRAKMLCQTLQELMAGGKSEESKQMLDRLLTMLLAEYQLGYADNDHALMQNTGVYDSKPIHIDVGQFIKNNSVKNPKIYHRELFNKTYKFRKWLEKKYPELAQHLELRLQEIIGEDYLTMKPYFHQGDVAKIPHVDQELDCEEDQTVCPE